MTVVFRETALRNLARMPSEHKDLYSGQNRPLNLVSQRRCPSIGSRPAGTPA
jgi:hypothetical protein